ncbi:hypothetical protein H696_00855 [Fonticula alba]|uniref:PHD-type domain-containing protein n=1 Tax=Fonticula alba TaxID=691883 RepID=A0A058ZG29_FONAL|nr:hypothetical protein H696_00855 [Fonticula alba]KCV73314.1 hypothetical protein H696_00855 [Fonticula alba]|eukprot:XP_009493015.1 hypothetical protein H696_00855 [Fonticula alba]
MAQEPAGPPANESLASDGNDAPTPNASGASPPSRGSPPELAKLFLGGSGNASPSPQQPLMLKFSISPSSSASASPHVPSSSALPSGPSPSLPASATTAPSSTETSPALAPTRILSSRAARAQAREAMLLAAAGPAPRQATPILADSGAPLPVVVPAERASSPVTAPDSGAASAPEPAPGPASMPEHPTRATPPAQTLPVAEAANAPAAVVSVTNVASRPGTPRATRRRIILPDPTSPRNASPTRASFRLRHQRPGSDAANGATSADTPGPGPGGISSMAGGSAGPAAPSAMAAGAPAATTGPGAEVAAPFSPHMSLSSSGLSLPVGGASASVAFSAIARLAGLDSATGPAGSIDPSTLNTTEQLATALKAISSGSFSTVPDPHVVATTVAAAMACAGSGIGDSAAAATPAGGVDLFHPAPLNSVGRNDLRRLRQLCESPQLIGSFLSTLSLDPTVDPALRIYRDSAEVRRILAENAPSDTSRALAAADTTADVAGARRRTSSRATSALIQTPASSDSDSDDHHSMNNEYCDCCRGPGTFLCCDRCPRSFHFVCANPPVEQSEIPEGNWYCNACLAEMFPLPKQPRPDRFGFIKMIERIYPQNPTPYSLPDGIKFFYCGVNVDPLSGAFRDDYDRKGNFRNGEWISPDASYNNTIVVGSATPAGQSAARGSGYLTTYSSRSYDADPSSGAPSLLHVAHPSPALPSTGDRHPEQPDPSSPELAPGAGDGSSDSGLSSSGGLSSAATTTYIQSLTGAASHSGNVGLAFGPSYTRSAGYPCYACRDFRPDRLHLVCDACGSRWHAECLPPLATLPSDTTRWRCPLHAATVLLASEDSGGHAGGAGSSVVVHNTSTYRPRNRLCPPIEGFIVVRGGGSGASAAGTGVGRAGAARERAISRWSLPSGGPVVAAGLAARAGLGGGCTIGEPAYGLEIIQDLPAATAAMFDGLDPGPLAFYNPTGGGSSGRQRRRGSGLATQHLTYSQDLRVHRLAESDIRMAFLETLLRRESARQEIHSSLGRAKRPATQDLGCLVVPRAVFRLYEQARKRQRTRAADLVAGEAPVASPPGSNTDGGEDILESLLELHASGNPSPPSPNQEPAGAPDA